MFNTLIQTGSLLSTTKFKYAALLLAHALGESHDLYKQWKLP